MGWTWGVCDVYIYIKEEWHQVKKISEKKSIIWRGGVRESNSMQMSHCEE